MLPLWRGLFIALESREEMNKQKRQPKANQKLNPLKIQNLNNTQQNTTHAHQKTTCAHQNTTHVTGKQADHQTYYYNNGIVAAKRDLAYTRFIFKISVLKNLKCYITKL